MRICCRIAARLAPLCTALAILVNTLHPVLHGTALDGGALDALIANLNMFAAYFSSYGSAETE